MPDPLLSLIIAVALFAFGTIIFWPGWGLAAQLRKNSRTGRRVLMEDALKHVYECEENNETCTYKSLAGSLSLDAEKVALLLTRLENMRLITLDANGFKLTREGHDYALRIIRVHRLYERYLAEETGVPETAWHSEADKKEHQISLEQANELSRQLGYPRYDPHGDPIPTKTGDLPPRQGRPLTSLDVGDTGQVVHVEDEPRNIYSELVNRGITLGVQVKVVARTPEVIEILIDGKKMKISLLVAGNVTIGPLFDEKTQKTPLESLSVLKPGESAEVVGIARACRGTQRRRLMDLGIIPGTVITSELESLSRDPVGYKIRGAVIALRKEQAELIYVRRGQEAA
jgi:DtxR family Mn-dependent transcriptional regulator